MSSLIYVFTGEGKGKTSAALGMLLRGYCNNMKVAWIGWYKEASWGMSEINIPKHLKDVTFEVLGKGFYFKSDNADIQKISNDVRVAKTKKGVVIDSHTKSEHRIAAQAAFQRALELISSQTLDVLICDEICQAVEQELVDREQIEMLMEKRKKTHLVLTGRDCPQFIIDVADTVSNIQNVKHAYEKGIVAQKGLDF